MAKRKKGVRGSIEGAQKSAALAIAEKGVTTGQDFARLMSTLMTDLISGAVTPQIGNAVCNAGGKLLKVVEMQHKYGTVQQTDGSRILLLTGPQQQPYPEGQAPQA